MAAQAVRFSTVGAACALIDFGCYHALLGFGIWVHLAKALSFAVGTTAAYFLNKRFTFCAESGGIRQAGSFALLYALTFLVNVGTNALALRLLPQLPGEYTVAWLAAQGTATTINFVALRSVIFRPKKTQAGSPDWTDGKVSAMK